MREDREIRDPAGNNNGASTTTLSHARNDSSTLASTTLTTNSSRTGGEEEWKNIHTMLNCISAMVDKTKRAITILQQRGIDTNNPLNHPNADTSMSEIKRQTEEKISEFRRNAEDAVNQVKRQAMAEIQRAVSASENRAIESIAQERSKMEKLFASKQVLIIFAIL